MKKILTKISASFLALIVLFSSMSFTVEKHYCGETLVDVSYFGEAESCCAKAMKEMDHKEKKSQKKGCCSDEVEIIESSTFDKEKITSFTPQELQFLTFYVFSYINLFQEVDLEKEFYKDFSPPDIVQDIQVLHETFLI
jgi:hypothetical protein